MKKNYNKREFSNEVQESGVNVSHPLPPKTRSPLSELFAKDIKREGSSCQAVSGNIPNIMRTI